MCELSPLRLLALGGEGDEEGVGDEGDEEGVGDGK